MPIDQDALERLRRLRSLGVKRGARDLARPAARPPGPETGLPGEVVETPHGPAWLRTERFALDDHPDLSALLEASPQALAGLGRDPALFALDPRRAAFIDTETTGLSLGTGTYTFLIGVGTYEKTCFVVRQFLMRNPAEERAQLHLVDELLSGCTGIVSFNGRSFDLPLIQNRYTLAYLPPPLPGAPHLDLLPAARRLWRARLASCALSELERQVLGVQRTAADVPGWMIPGIYRDFYRTEAAPDTVELMGRVLYHNLVDITSMARLAGQTAPLFEPERLPECLAGLHPVDCFSLARCYEALTWSEAAETAYKTVLAGSLPDSTRSEALHALAMLCKRLGRHAEAAELWESCITAGTADDILALVELAKHHEWHTGDLAAARGWTAWAVKLIAMQPADPYRDGILAELQHRLARIEGKLAGR